MQSTYNPGAWFQIPVEDMPRAIKFYETVFGYQLTPMQDMAWFPSAQDAPGCGGCLVKHPLSIPSKEGTVVHIASPSGDLDKELARIPAAGGKVLHPKTNIGPNGFFAFFEDVDGNKVGIHSMK